MRIYIASDHAGFELKGKLISFLRESGHEVTDKGPYKFDALDDYPDFLGPVADSVAADPNSIGIVMGGSGQGEAMVVNRKKGVRAAVYYGGTLEIVRLARQHNNANVLSLAARFVTEEEAKDAVSLFLSTPFSGDERHIRRIKKIEI